MANERAGNWLRVSSGGQDEENQLPDNLRHCEANGYEIAATYTVHGKSAYHGHQDPDWRRVVADVKSGRIDVVVIWKVDRLDRRNILHAIPMANAVLDAGGRIEFSTQPYIDLTTMPGRMAFANMCEMAYEESKVKSDRVLGKHRGIKAAGGFVGRRPYGYRIVCLHGCGPVGAKHNHPKTLEPDPVTSEIVREMVARYLDGWSLAAIANWLDAAGVPCSNSRTCKAWDPNIVRKILGSETLIGKRRHGKNRDLHRFKPILDWATWVTLQETLTANSRRRGGLRKGGRKEPAMLTGIAYCLLCGGIMHWRVTVTHNKNGSDYAWAGYRCDGTPKAPSRCRNMISAAELEGRVHEEIGKLTDIERVTETLVRGEDPQEALDRLRDEADALDPFDPGDDEKRAELRAKAEEIRLRGRRKDKIERVFTGVSMADHWASLDPQGQRAMLLEDGVRVYAARVDGVLACRLEAESEAYLPLTRQVSPAELRAAEAAIREAARRPGVNAEAAEDA
jgi:DNA invertase Pin-like site-specific DNA recombinase